MKHLPTTFQLAQLAAIVYSNSGAFSVPSAVEMARQIWVESQKTIETLHTLYPDAKSD